MSVAEIMQEIPRLSLADRRLLTNKLLEMEPEREAMNLCDHLADEAAGVFDRMEEDDARGVQG